MICPDCELEVDKLNSRGICGDCYKRIYSCKGKGREYIPLKDIKGTVEYNRAMGRRLATREKRENSEKKINKKVIPVKEDKTEDVKIKYYAKVNKDLENEFKKENINKDYLKTDLPEWVETFWGLLQDDNIILDATKANKVFDSLSYLYLHNQLRVEWEDQSTILENSLYAKALLELRRPTKDFINYWKSIAKVINYIKEDENLMALIQDCRNNCYVKKLEQDSPLYFTEIDNDLSQSMDNAVITDKEYKYYNIKVTVKGLYGHNYNETFKLDTPMYALSEESAKKKFIEFMNDKFPTVKYNPVNIKIEEVF